MTNDPFNLERFVIAQAKDNKYQAALCELLAGKKLTHWMWFIFPQIDGLGFSSYSKLYAIKSAEEARQYLEYRELGENLRKCVQALLNLEGPSASAIFGSPDDMKLKSSMTLFASVQSEETMFARVLDTYFQGERDSRTLKLLEQRRS